MPLYEAELSEQELSQDAGGCRGGMADPTPRDAGSDEPQDEDVMSTSDQCGRDRYVADAMAPLASCGLVRAWNVYHLEHRRGAAESGTHYVQSTEYRVTLDVTLTTGRHITGIGRDLADAVLKVMAQAALLTAAVAVEMGKRQGREVTA